MKPPKPGTHRGIVFDAVDSKPKSTKELAQLTRLSVANTGYVLSQLKKMGLIRSKKSLGAGLLWHKKTDKPEPALETLPAVQTLIPDIVQPMLASDAITTLMRTEQQNILHRQTLQQILAVYEQLGNILEMAGLIED